MSFFTLCDREIKIQPVNECGRDAHGVPIKELCEPVGPIRARRTRTRTDEDIVDRDQQDRTYLYLFHLRTIDGAEVCPRGSDRIIDEEADITLEIVGSPIRANRRRIPHHWEARARIVTG